MALLSIIVPIYNKEAYIDSCMESVLKQSFSDFELILVNDGSTDKSGEKCDYYSTIDSRIVVVHQHNQGVSEARNTGLDMAKGKYIGFVDCDDSLEADMYETLISTAIQYEADIVICGVRKIFPDKEELYYGTNTIKVYNRSEAIKGLLKKEFARSVYDKIFKAELAKSVRFEGSMYEDTFYNFLVLNAADKVVYNDVLKYNYIIRDNSVSMTRFSSKYMDAISFSKRMHDVCQEKTPEHINDAKNFDFVTNISLLNLILMGDKKEHLAEYDKVVNNIYSYADYVNKGSLSRKHKYAYRMFKFNPSVYEAFMKLYCKISDAHVAKKK